MDCRQPDRHRAIPEIEDKSKGLIFDPYSSPFYQPLLFSTHNSLESIAAPQEADLDDKQIRALLASLRCLLEREASAERSRIYHFEREGLMSRSSQSLNFLSTGTPVAWLSHQKRLGQDEFSEKEEHADIFKE